MRAGKVLVAIMLSIIVTLVTMNTAIGVSFGFFHVVGLILCFVLGKTKTERIKLFGIFCSIFTIYTLYSIIVHLGHIDNDGFFLYSDQGYFYPNIDELASANSIIDIFQKTLVDRVHRDYEGFFFLHGTIAYIAKNYFSGNSIFLQSLHISFYGVLINLFVYKTLTYYIPSKISLKYTLSFALLTPIFYYSPWIFRDIHITLLYSIAIYLVHTKFRASTFLIFGILVIITLEFRLEHGLFLLIFPALYLYKNKKESYILSRLWPVVIFFGTLLFIGVFLLFLQEFEKSVSTLQMYEDYTSEALNDGIGAQLYKLPFGLKQIALTLNSQITPLPPWANLTTEKGFYVFVVGFITLITAIYWSYLFVYILYAMSTKSVRGKIPSEIWVVLGVFFLFVLLNTANINIRRIIGVYPLLFIFYACLRVNILQPDQDRKYRRYSLITYTILLLTYTILKASL